MKFSLKQKIALLVSLTLLTAGGIYAYISTRDIRPALKTPKEEIETTTAVINEEPDKERTICPFEGLPVEGKLYKTIAVIYDNHNDALPHTGISQACFVIETLAEGGITRIEAFFAHRKPKAVGPVRSARIYFVDFALSYDALLAHCGGSPDALATLRRLPIDLDQIRFPEPYFRDRSRRAPHNLYGRIDSLLLLAKKRGYDLTPSQEVFFNFRTPELPYESTASAKKITVPFSSRSYTYTWTYDEKNGIYLRYTAKGLYKDILTGTPPPVKNLVIIKASMKTRDSKGRLDLTFSQDGPAWFFYGGTMLRGSYKKSPGRPFKFYLENGEEVQFEPGLIWLEILPADKNPAIKG